MGDEKDSIDQHQNRVFSQLVFGDLLQRPVPSLIRSQKMPDEDSFSKEMNGEDNGEDGKQVSNTETPPEVRIDIEKPPPLLVNGLKISLNNGSRNVNYSSIGYDNDDDNDEVDNNNQKKAKKVVVALPFWRRQNRIFSVRPTSADDDDKRNNPRSAKQIRRMRKKVSVTDERSGHGKKPTNQADLAMAIVEGDLVRVEDIVDAYVMLYGADGFNTVVGFRYDIDQRTMLITCVGSHAEARADIENDDDEYDSRNVEAEMFLGLSALHIACVFDQEQVLEYFLKYGKSASQHALLGPRTPSGQSLLHSCAWFGTVAPMQVLLSKGADVGAENERHQQPLHLAALKGQMTCLKILVSFGGGTTDLECEDRRGRTPLHEAVEAGHYDCAQELVYHDADVNKVDDVSGAPLHYASTVELVALLMANGADPNVQIEEDHHHHHHYQRFSSSSLARGGEETKSRTTVFSLYLRKMPEGCNEILTNYLHSNGTSIGAKNLEVCFNYDLFLKDFERNPSDGEIRSLTRVAQLDQRDLLKHPVCESFLHMKWLLVRNYFRAYLFFYFQFLACLTTLVMLDFSPIARDLEVEAKYVVTWICVVDSVASVAILIAKNVFLMFYNFGLYVTTFQNFIEMMMLGFTATFLILHLIDSQLLHQADYTTSAAIVHLAAISLFTSWFNFTLIQGKLPSGGIYINMVVAISRDFLMFLVLYTSTLIAFALCFHILSNDHENFKDPITSILCVISMMVGEIDFTANFTEAEIIYKGTTEVVFVLFLLFVSIVIMNLLVGLAISNITKQFQSAGVYRLKMTVLLINMIEEALGFLRKICPCLVRNSQLFPYLLRTQEWSEDGKDDDVDMSVYVYPNEKGNTVYVKNAQGNRKRTGLVIPQWVMANTYKYLQKDTTGSVIAAAAEKRRLEDKINKMSSEVRRIKWDVRGIRQDIQSIVSFIKSDNVRTTPRSKH